MAFTTVQIVVFAALFVLFLGVPMITSKLGSSLDSLPMRLGAVLLVLAFLPFDKYISIGLFIVIAAIYAQHHTDSVKSILNLPEVNGRSPSSFDMPFKGFEPPSAVSGLQKGGSTDVTYDEMDFMPKQEDQSDAFAPVGESIDRKHALQTEPLGARAQSLFPEDSMNAESLMRDSANGANAN